jgi:regulator of RNase E activity RraA
MIESKFSASTIEQLREFETTLLANTIEHIDKTPAHQFYLSGEIQSVTTTLSPTVGIAVTCEIDSGTPEGAAQTDLWWEQLAAIEKQSLPVVWVVKTVGSRPEHECVIGDGMAKLLASVGCIGLVTDGRVRDVAGLMTVPFAVYSRGLCVHHTGLRFRSIDCPVEIGGLTIHPGDLLHAGTEGVIRIPDTCADRLAEAAVRMRAFEHEVHMAFRRTDLSLQAKRDLVKEVIATYGFGDCVASPSKK